MRFTIPARWLTTVLMLAACTPALAEEPKTAITVYNQGMALVRQTRTLDLEKGAQEYSYDGVASEIDPTSVLLKGKGVQVLEQNYEYDLVDRSALMRKYVGEEVEVQLENTGGVVMGRLLTAGDPVIIEEDDGRIRMLNSDAIMSVDFPELPAGLMLKPTLRWKLFADKGGKTDATLSYITRGIQWEASYVAVVSPDDDAIDLAGWVQIDNRSGATYADAKLKLMAGDVQVEPRWRKSRAPFEMLDEANALAGAGGFEEKEFFEYHLYTLPRPVTVKDKQQKQISLFEPATTPAKKVLTYDHNVDATKVTVTMEFENAEENGLGLPLPKGLVRLMKADSDGSLEFIGEDRIDHTPKDETLRLVTGKAFDIVAERTVTDQTRRGNVQEIAVTVELRNHKREAVDVVVVEHFWGNWEIMEESLSGKKTSAFGYEWLVQVPADGETKLTFKVKNWR